MLRLDHVMYVVRNLDDGARRILFETGLDSYPGGEHTGVGTHNRIIPLGEEQYVELMAVMDHAVAAQSPVGQLVAEWAAEREGLRLWCLSTEDIEAVGRRLELEPAAWSRRLPDGTELRWRLVGVQRSMADPSLPFFIQWDVPPDQHPSRREVGHTVEPAGIAWLEVGGDPDRIDTWTDGAQLPVHVVSADAGPRALGVVTSDGEAVLR